MNELDPQKFVSKVEFKEFKSDVLTAISDLGTSIESRIDKERVHHDQEMDKVENSLGSIFKRQAQVGQMDWKLAASVVAIFFSVLIFVMNRLDGLDDRVAGNKADVDAQILVSEAVKPFEEAFRSRAINLIETEDSRNDIQDSQLAAIRSEIKGFEVLLRDETEERQSLELRLEGHMGDGHPGRVESQVQGYHAESLRIREEIMRAIHLIETRVQSMRESRFTEEEGDDVEKELTELRALIERIDERTKP